MVTDFKTSSGKDSELFDILHTHFGKTINLSRLKFMAKMIVALVTLRTVNFVRLSTAFRGKASAPSSMRRIQRFMSGYDLDLSLVARLVFRLLPHEGPYVLSMDRTNWQFGSFDINALVLAVTYQGVAFPLLFRLLPKKGNSNTKERIELMERYIRLFGKSTIDCLVADREFVGRHWIGWLNDNRIRYHIRIRENFWVHNPHNGRDFKAFWVFQGLKEGESKHLPGIYLVNNQYCYLSAARMKNREGKPELQILLSFNKPEEAVDTYKMRWQIETCFKSLKSSGFNVEDTHLADIERIERLFAILTIAFLWAYLVGIFKDRFVKPIRTLNNGRKAFSFFKYGLDTIASVLLNPDRQTDIDIFKILSCT